MPKNYQPPTVEDEGSEYFPVASQLPESPKDKFSLPLPQRPFSPITCYQAGLQSGSALLSDFQSPNLPNANSPKPRNCQEKHQEICSKLVSKSAKSPYYSAADSSIPTPKRKRPHDPPEEAAEVVEETKRLLLEDPVALALRWNSATKKSKIVDLKE